MRGGPVQHGPLIPVTIRQILTAVQAHQGGPFIINDVEIVKVVIVAHLLSFEKSNPYFNLFILEDGSGKDIIAHQWKGDLPDADLDVCAEYDIKPHMYVRIIGAISKFKDRPNDLTVSSLRKVIDPHEVYHHLLQAMLTTVIQAKGPPPLEVVKDAKPMVDREQYQEPSYYDLSRFDDSQYPVSQEVGLSLSSMAGLGDNLPSTSAVPLSQAENNAFFDLDADDLPTPSEKQAVLYTRKDKDKNMSPRKLPDRSARSDAMQLSPMSAVDNLSNLADIAGADFKGNIPDRKGKGKARADQKYDTVTLLERSSLSFGSYQSSTTYSQHNSGPGSSTSEPSSFSASRTEQGYFLDFCTDSLARYSLSSPTPSLKPQKSDKVSPHKAKGQSYGNASPSQASKQKRDNILPVSVLDRSASQTSRPTASERSRSDIIDPSDPYSRLTILQRRAVLYIMEQKELQGNSHSEYSHLTEQPLSIWEGVHVKPLTKALAADGTSKKDIFEAVEELIEEGYLFLTTDEFHLDLTL